MDKSVPLQFQEVIFSSSDTTLSRNIGRLEKQGKLKKIAPKIYTSNLEEPPETIIKRNAFLIIGHLYPGILLSHRSALEYKPTGTANLFLTYGYARKVKLPGLTLNILDGPKPVAGDNLFVKGLFVSQQERAILENLQESRKSGPESKTITLREIEEKLEQIVRVKGEEELNVFRDKARLISAETGMTKEFDKLNKLISALLTTKPSGLLRSPVALARVYGSPYDPARIELLEKLFIRLQQRVFAAVPEQNITPQAFRNFAFYEAYFSNYIEGTKFEVQEAKQIIATGEPMQARDEDSHDILGTYQLVSSRTEMQQTPSSAEELLSILRYRHKILLRARLSKNPGEFKEQNNRAGDTTFVDFKLVRGTLIRGFDYYRLLTEPFAKAAYMMFLISEVHPFDDGNGRIARVMMNAELVKKEQSKIIIPNAFRIDYLGALRKLTRQHEPDVYINMLQRAQLFSAKIKGDDIELMQQVITETNAFKEGDDDILKL
ncbi:MAG: cell filamentation protein Fic [Sphingobacteriaceae bacterium]|nr:MAG: cell filamentation protein Fic [Sphingobacteriaceae bacterium]